MHIKFSDDQKGEFQSYEAEISSDGFGIAGFEGWINISINAYGADKSEASENLFKIVDNVISELQFLKENHKTLNR